MLSTDRTILDPGSSAASRMREYGDKIKRLVVVVGSDFSSPGAAVSLSEKVTVFPARSSSRLFRPVSLFARARNIMLGDHFDVVTAQDPFETGFVGMRLSRRFKTAFEVQVHTDLFSPYFRRTSFINRVRLLFVGRVIPRANVVRVVFSRLKTEITERGFSVPEKIEVLPIAVPLDEIRGAKRVFRFGERFAGLHFFAVTVARLEKEKNIETAISVMSEIISRYPFVGYVIVGDGSLRERLEKCAGPLLDRNIFFMGYAENVISYLKGANIFFLPSFYEGFGLVFIEAAACHIPIVATEVGIMGSLFRDGKEALVCPVGDRECLSRSIVRLIENNGLREELTLAAETLVEKEFTESDIKYPDKVTDLWEKAAKSLR